MELILLLLCPALLTLVLQCVLCGKAYRRIVRHSPLLIPLLLFLLALLVLLQPPGGGFLDLRSLVALFFCAMGSSALLGWGLARLLFHLKKRRQSKSAK